MLGGEGPGCLWIDQYHTPWLMQYVVCELLFADHSIDPRPVRYYFESGRCLRLTLDRQRGEMKECVVACRFPARTQE